MKIIIDVSHDHILINGQRVDRPDTVSPSQWQEFWERAKRLKMKGEADD